MYSKLPPSLVKFFSLPKAANKTNCACNWQKKVSLLTRNYSLVPLIKQKHWIQNMESKCCFFLGLRVLAVLTDPVVNLPIFNINVRSSDVGWLLQQVDCPVLILMVSSWFQSQMYPLEGIRTQCSHLYDLSVHQKVRVEIHRDSSLRRLYMCRLSTQT